MGCWCVWWWNIIEWNGVSTLTQVAPAYSSEKYIYSMAVYNNKLYVGTAPMENYLNGIILMHGKLKLKNL